jgi:hypothetical protein
MRHLLAAVAGIALAVSGASAAPIVGYFTDNAALNTDPAAGIAAVGYTPFQITNIGTQNFAGLNMIVINEANNGAPSAALLSRTADLAAFVAGGGALIVHSRNVNSPPSDAAWVPGLSGTTLVRSLGTDINVVTPGLLPSITNTNLDGGNFSTHGFATAGTLPTGATNILSTANPSESVAFGFKFGNGFVFYSTSPLDFYLAGAGNNPPGDTFRTTYYQDVLRLANARVAAVPEPLSIAVFGGLLGLGGLAARRRMKVAA